jgi:hypothetical protein
LRRLYTNWENRHRKYEETSAFLIWNLANGLGQYVAALQSYRVMNFGYDGEEQKRYIEPLIVTLDKDGIIQFSKPEYVLDVLTRDDRGYWISAIQITLDRAENIFPKSDFRFALFSHCGTANVRYTLAR